MDRIEFIKELQNNPYKHQKNQTLVLNNFFSILTIVMISICVVIYTVYVLPSQKKEQKRELNLKKQKEFYLLREKQIALSHKINKKEYNKIKNEN